MVAGDVLERLLVREVAGRAVRALGVLLDVRLQFFLAEGLQLSCEGLL